MADRTSSKSLPEGIRIRNRSIQIYFKRKGKKYDITLPHPPTTEGISAASKIRSDLITKAEWGIITDADIATARGIAIEDNTIIVGNGVLFQEVAQKYLKRWKGDQNTKINYVNTLNHHWMPARISFKTDSYNHS